MIEIFNSREIAVGIWVSIFFIISLFEKKLRKCYQNILTVFFNRKIIIPFILMIFYVIVSIYFLEKINLWQENQIKNSIIWFATSASVTFFRLNDIENPEEYFSAALKDNFKIIIFLEFVISFYTFGLITEFILLPFLLLLGVLKAKAEIQKENQELLPTINFILGIFTLITIIFTIYKLYTSFESFKQNTTFYDLISPICLSLLIIPFHYFLYKYILFEVVYIRIKSTFKNKRLIKYSFIKSLIFFRFNKTKINRWLFKVNMEQLKTKKEISNSMREIKERILIEKNPPKISKTDGWSPFYIITQLEKLGINMGDYKESYNNEWYSCSNYITIESEEIIKNNIAFYIEGNSSIASEIKIVLNVNNLNSEKNDIEKLILYVKKITKFSTKLDLQNKIIAKLKKKINYKTEIDLYSFEIQKDLYLNSNNYELKFSIKITKPNTV
ncbi:hypothetical protein KO566_10685 [Flavobacteriaceae bacterium XHP0103]|uniref:hypothetical protein n=1 Tax=Marixanthotalea marina TaxID=2844359 RepID=UPI002989C6DB|nr:hypothetical protein [Marixanthotalea marina]MBU3822530.1 hypothetical protein [Marixanthotalea marina]